MSLAVRAEIPAGYYSRLEGKSGEDLQKAVKSAALPADYFIVKYGDAANTDFDDGYEHTLIKSWQVFATSDVRTINGVQIWWDMYSNQLAKVAEGHASMNIEHSVANSWWGGKDANIQAYSDLMHLNPSDGTTNQAKSDTPLGKVGSNVTFDNGLSRIGTPAAGFGGESGKVFEPADEYKGDFARAYLYIFTAYDDISWLDNKGGAYMLDIANGKATMKPWVVDMLLSWSAADPVDDKEIFRNNEIYRYQKNRNPFIDYPSLPEYIWGEKKGEAFWLAGSEAVAVNRPADPTVADARMSNVNTYEISYWGNRDVEFNCTEGDLWISLDGGDYQRYGNSITVPAGNIHNNSHELKAYSMQQKSGYELRSSIVTVTLTAKDPDVVDYTTAAWTPAAEGDAIIPGEKYVIIADVNSHVMSTTCGKNGYMEDAGLPEFNGSDICLLPQGAATIDFIDVGSGNFAIHISDMGGKNVGYWSTSAAKKMKIDSNQGVGASISISRDLTAVIDFDMGGAANLGTLQYNKSNPRFLNYSSQQGAVRLYRFKSFANESSAVEKIQDQAAPVVVSGSDIIAPEGSLIYDLNGRRVSGQGLQTGIYIVATPAGAVKVFVR